MKKFILAFLLIILGAGFHSVSADIIVDDPNIDALTMTKTGVGIFTSSPKERLTVNG
ncbi:MAG: hypothetical protein IH901_03840, partial [Proteobacteria bacterium]|nr:hypothetical protein [Pseudomonadota bacterium]